MALGALIFIIALIMIIAIWVIAERNSFNRMTVKIDEASSDIDVALTKRYDVLTKMMDTCRAFAKHETDTLFKVIRLRSGMSVEDKNAVMSDMNDNLDKIRVLAENYPELRSSDTFVTLQKGIADTEEHLQASRRFFNAAVSAYNQKIVSFPSSMIASGMGLSKKDFFVAEESKKRDVKIEL